MATLADRPPGSPNGSNDMTDDQARQLMVELTEVFRRRKQSGGGERSPSDASVERIKLLANYLNTVAAGLLTAGLVGPVAAYLLGFAATSRSALEIVQSILIVLMLSVILHLAGRGILGRLE